MRFAKFGAVVSATWIVAMLLALKPPIGGVETVVLAGDRAQVDSRLDHELRKALKNAGFTGDIERIYRKRLQRSLGRALNPQLAELGRLLWFDKIHSANRDNTCGGCHSPTHGMGDSQPMAIGVQNN